jgi:hypothetical protein
MLQTAALPPEQGFAAEAQVLNLRSIKGIQGPCHRRLLGKRLASPGLGQDQVRPQPRVDLDDRTTARQHADQGIK